MEILIILLLILLNGLFSMSEIALISARKNRLETAAKKGNSHAKVALKLANSPNTFLSTVQIGITLIGILTGVYSSHKITHDVYEFIASFSILQPYANSLATVIGVIVLTFFSLVLGELLPKRIGLNFPESIAKAVAVPMQLVSKITMPFIWLLTVSTEGLLKIFQIKPTADGKVTEEEIKAIIKEGTEVGEVQEIEQEIVERVFHIGDRKVNSLMTHRNDIVYLTQTASFDSIKATVFNKMHSVYPVCKDNLDEVIGVVLLKDLLVGLEHKDFKLNEITREATYLIEHTSAFKALEHFKTTKNFQALIVDEHGIFQGIITLNDILEALVGDASDFDDDEYQLITEADGSWTVDGQYSLHDFLTYFDMDELIGDYDVTTISGLITTEMGYIPKKDEELIWNKMRFTILETAGAKVEKIKIAPYLNDN